MSYGYIIVNKWGHFNYSFRADPCFMEMMLCDVHHYTELQCKITPMGGIATGSGVSMM